MRSCDAEIGRINIKNTINQHFDSYLNTFLGHLEFYENYLFDHPLLGLIYYDASVMTSCLRKLPLMIHNDD